MKLKINFPEILFYTSVILVVYMFFENILNDMPFVDSSIYIMMGNIIKDNKEIYNDLWDHKGPILYLINFFGSLLTDKSSIGINIIQLILFLLLIFFLKKKIVLKENLKNYLIIFFILSYITLFIGGNSPADWFILTATYIYVIFFNYVTIPNYLNLKEKKIFCFFLGLSTCFIFLIKFSLINGLLFISLIFFYFNKKIFFNLLKFYIFGVICILPIIVLLLKNENLLNDIIDNYLIMNFHYGFQKSIDENIILKLLRSIYINLRDKFFIIITALALIIFNIYLIFSFIFKKKITEIFKLFLNQQLTIFLIIFIFDLLSILVSHIFEISYKSLIPSMLIFNLFFLTKMNLNYNLKKLNIIPMLALILISLYFNHEKIFTKKFNYNDLLFIKNLNQEIKKNHDLSTLAIGSLGNGTMLFIKTDLVSISNYHFTPFIRNFNILDPIYQDYLEKIKLKKPRYIILNPYMFGTFWENENKHIKEITRILKEDYKGLKIKLSDSKGEGLKMFKNTSIYILR